MKPSETKVERPIQIEASLPSHPEGITQSETSPHVREGEPRKMNAQQPDWMIFIGKWGDAVDGHPLAYHLIDSAAVAGLLWEQALTPGARQQFCRWLQLPEVECGRFLAFWTCLHDLGKATPAFQNKHAPTQDKLVKAGFDFPPLSKGDTRHHSLLSQWILKDLKDDLGVQPWGILHQFRFAIGGHHGCFHVEEDEQRVNSLGNLGGEKWTAARRDLFNHLVDLLRPPTPPQLEMSRTDRNAFFNLLTGFFITADWISSQDDLFNYHEPTLSLAGYREESQRRAVEALQKTGWIGWQPDDRHPGFSELFSYPPLPLQNLAVQAADGLQNPFLMIIEAPTGCGKTETALLVADRAIQQQKLRGCYIAMPTQATSNQMFERVKHFLQKRYSNQDWINLQLVHGNAWLNKDFQNLRFNGIKDEDQDQPENAGNVAAMDWFLPRKRSLLASFGVGTVDQAFLSVLCIKHQVLRLFGLHRKVVIFDEVHAYDVYMVEIFCQLLAWLRAIGTSVVILSATLPESTRQQLLKAYQVNAVDGTIATAYPRLSLNDGQKMSSVFLGKFDNRTIYLKPAPRDAKDWLNTLRQLLADGGCAAVVCNTVDRAQEVYQAIQKENLVAPEDLFCLHARLPFCWRKAREEEILSCFGKLTQAPAAPRRGIVVATQIIEQSLDLDFDLLITDLAPVDLLIQRMGRLHRHAHQKFPPLRPAALQEPCCLVCQPGLQEGQTLPDFEKDQYVYDPVFLNRTYFALLNRNFLSLPEMSDELINLVYSEASLPGCTPAQMAAISERHTQMANKSGRLSSAAQNRLIGDVDCANAFGKNALPAGDSDADDMAGLTRGSVLPTVQLVCLVRREGRTVLLDEGFELDVEAPPEPQALSHLHASMVKISKRDVVQHFAQQLPHAAWKTQPSLREAFPVVFEDGECALGSGLTLVLDEKTGIHIKTE